MVGGWRSCESWGDACRGGSQGETSAVFYRTWKHFRRSGTGSREVGVRRDRTERGKETLWKEKIRSRETLMSRPHSTRRGSVATNSAQRRVEAWGKTAVEKPRSEMLGDKWGGGGTTLKIESLSGSSHTRWWDSQPPSSCLSSRQELDSVFLEKQKCPEEKPCRYQHLVLSMNKQNDRFPG